MNTQNDRLAQYLVNVKYLLQNLTIGDEFLTIAFGDKFDFPILNSILTPWDNGDFSNLPEIKILSSEILGNANGGYSQQTNTIYLADTFLNNAQPYTIEGVILEEIGHWIDAQINTVDPVWDEGEVFAKIVLGQELNPVTLQTLKTENDWSIINIENNQISIEQSVSADPSIPERKYSDGTVAKIKYQAFTGSLFYEGINFLDVAQGWLSDCYLLAALAELAQHNSGAINNIIRSISGSSNYSVTIDGINIEINNNLPVYDNPGFTNDGKSVFAKFKFSNESKSWEEGWVALIEKGYALVNSQQDLDGPKTYTAGVNSYSTIENGFAIGAVLDLVGGTSSYKSISQMSDQEIHSLLSNNTRPTFLSTIGDGKKKDPAGVGLAQNHAYSVIGYQPSTNTYRLFNPWNSDGTNDDGVIGRFADVTIAQIRQVGSEISYVDNIPSFNLWDGGGSVSFLKAPTDILIYGLPLEFRKADGLSISQIWASDPNGWTDLKSVKFWLESQSGTRINLATVTSFSPFTGGVNWGKVNDLFFSASTLNNLGVGTGIYTLKAQSEDQSGLLGTIYSQSLNIVGNLAPEALSIFEVPSSVLNNQNLVINQIFAKDLDGWQDIARIDYWMFDPSGNLIELKDSTQFFAWSGNDRWAETNAISFSPSEYATGGTGIYEFYAQVFDQQGQTIQGSESLFKRQIEVLPSNVGPGNVLIYEIPETQANNENLVIGQIWAYDPDGWQDISRIDYWIIDPSGNLIELKDSNSFTPWSENNTWAGTDPISFDPNEYALGGDGVYTFKAQAIDSSGIGGSVFQKQITIFTPYDDAYELNNTRETAYYLGFNQNVWLSNYLGIAVQGDDDWYEIYVEPGYERLVVDLEFTHANGDIDLAVYDANGNFITSSESVSDNEFIDTILPGSGSYYLKVFFSDSANIYDLKWNSLLLPSLENDNFANSILLSGQTISVTGSNSEATGETGEPNHGDFSTPTNSVWWSWTATSNGIVTIDTSGSNFDTTLGVYTGSTLSGLTTIASNDDSATDLTTLTSLVTFNVVNGTTYKIAVDGYDNATGDIRLNINAREVTDTVRSSITYTLPDHVKNLILEGTENINGTGNALNNSITGNSGHNSLIGGAGVDTLIGRAGNDTLNGGSSADSLMGGLGNDTYYVDNIGDQVIENLNQGSDKISSTVTYTLPANVEKLTLTGSANLTANGNNLANKLTGNTGNNSLLGKNGNDTLIGGLGNDILTGGAGIDTLTGGGGKDTFVYNSFTEGKDNITDFNRAQGDKININRTNFKLTNLTAGALQIDRFVLGTAAKDSDDRFIFNTANNTLFFDQDGTGSGFQQRAIALISNNIDLKASDLILV